MLRILSLGAGRQSSCIFLRSCLGDLPKLDHAIFADTGDEPAEVYDYLELLQKIGRQHGIPVHVVRRPGPSISEHIYERSAEDRRMDNIPFWTRGDDGRESCINRDCTREWKIACIKRKTKQLLGLSKAAKWPRSLAVETWLGIAADERQRMKTSQDSWQRFWHPLLEEEWNNGYAKLMQPGWRTKDCLRWIHTAGFPEPPRSACWHCPFRSNAQWRHLRNNCQDEWEKACLMDEQLRQQKIHGMRRDVFLHRSLKPLREAPIDDTKELPLFDNECAGVCGV